VVDIWAIKKKLKKRFFFIGFIFCALLGDEIKSTVSDTWSTDVLASDSEPPDQNQLDRLEEVAEENFMRPFVLGTRDQEV
jgi:hypothetical protein